MRLYVEARRAAGRQPRVYKCPGETYSSVFSFLSTKGNSFRAGDILVVSSWYNSIGQTDKGPRHALSEWLARHPSFHFERPTWGESDNYDEVGFVMHRELKNIDDNYYEWSE